jgi:hypothetical protein
MTAVERIGWRSAAVLAGVALLVVFGCGTDDGLGKRYPVSGTVNYKGQPLASGTISFIPDNPELRPANGMIEEGSYSLTTLTEGDGAMPGTYRVSIIAKEAKPLGTSPTGGAPSQKAAFLANKKAKSLIPSKYANPDTSNLKAEVKAQSNTFPFELVD